MSLDLLWSVIYLLGGGLVLCGVLLIWPLKGQKRGRMETADQRLHWRDYLSLFMGVVGFVLSIGLGSAVLIVWFEFSLLLGVGLSMMVFTLVYPMVADAQDKRIRQQLRQEGIGITEYIAGRMSSGGTLYEALNELYEDVVTGVRPLPLCQDDLEGAIVRVRLGKPLKGELTRIAQKYDRYPRFAQIWEAYGLLVDLGLGAEASAMQTEDVSRTQEMMDELINVLETELATAVATRFVMFLLIGGMSIYLMFFSVLGKSLTETVAGNVVIGFTLGGILLSQYVGRFLERMPVLEF